MKERTRSHNRKVVAIAEAAKRRRDKVVRNNLQNVADAVEDLAGRDVAESDRKRMLELGYEERN